MATATAKAHAYRDALLLIAEDIRDQLALEAHQRQTGVSSGMIDCVRADSYRRIIETVETALDVPLRGSGYHL